MFAEIILVFYRIGIVYKIDFSIALSTPVYFFIMLYNRNQNRYLFIAARSSDIKIVFVRLQICIDFFLEGILAQFAIINASRMFRCKMMPA